MLEATIYYFDDGEWTTRTTTFPFRTEATLKKHLTSIYGKSKMQDVFWDIIEPEPEENENNRNEFINPVRKQLVNF